MSYVLSTHQNGIREYRNHVPIDVAVIHTELDEASGIPLHIWDMYYERLPY